MQDIDLEVAVLCWNTKDVGGDSFEVRRLGDPYNDHGPHLMTGGAVYASWQGADTQARLLMLFGQVMSIMAGDGIPFDLIHPELLKIPEYRRQVLAPDVPGAEIEMDV